MNRLVLPRLSPRLTLALVAGALTVALLLYSQTMAFVWDEGFHLLAAQLIDNGKTPYIDFCFPQTPLNAYWNAFWMHIFGQGWRVTHVAAALELAGAVWLMADFVLLRFPVRLWQLPCALTTLSLIGLNNVFVQFGPIGQSYALALFLSVAAFRMTTIAVRRSSAVWAFCSGLLASGAAASTLLSAPVVPVLLVWMFLFDVFGKRLLKTAAFLTGCTLPFLPVAALFVKAPAQTLFNVFQYQAIFRRVKWAGATSHDVDVLGAWLESAPALLLGSLAIAGFIYLRKSQMWDRQRRSEFYLSGALGAALVAYIATAHPTFQRYFIVAIPFWAVLAAVGLYAVGSRLMGALHPAGPAVVVCGLMLLSSAKDLFDDRDSTRWSHYEEIAAKVKEVTPAGGLIYADEQVYFLLHRKPPPAMEFSYSHKLDLPPKQEALYHIVSESELNEQVRQGRFATVESCKDERIEEMKLAELFPHQQDIRDCSIFWGKVKAGVKLTAEADSQ